MLDTFVALDIETTGINPVYDSIIEIGAAKFEGGVITDRFETFINPARAISPQITSITGITDGMVANAPYLETVIGDVVKFTEGRPLLGHNIIFDYSFLKVAAKNCGFSFARTGIDTFLLARQALPDLPHKSLEALSDYFGIVTEHHRAYADAITAAKVYEKLSGLPAAEDFKNEVHELVYNIPKQEPATPKQKAFLGSLIKKHGVKYEKSLDTLTKSEASRTIDRILSTYGRC